MNQWRDDLVIAMKNGEDLAFEQCYQLLSPQVYSAILRICNDHASAQDLLHDTFINAFEKIATYNEQHSFIAWLKRIAFNNTFNHIKRQKLAFEVVDKMPEDEYEITPEQQLVDSNLLVTLLDTVPTSHRLLLWLYIVEQYSHDEIAALVGKTASYSKSIVSRSLKKLKSHPVVVTEKIARGAL